jgi:hypothetical protein
MDLPSLNRPAMQRSYMPTSLSTILLAAFFALIAVPGATAQPGHFPFGDAADSSATIDLVKRYLLYTAAEPVPVDSIGFYAVEEFSTWLDKASGVPIRFPESMPHRIVGARALRGDGALAMVTVQVDAGTIPMAGALGIDWVFFTRKVEGKGWRINALRRQKGIEDYVDQLRYLDTSSLYPAVLKPVIARETSRALLDNAGLRRHFMENSELFGKLVSYFNRKDSLWMLGRIDRAVTQLNQFGIDWGDGAQEIPKEAVSEIMMKLDAAQQKEMRTRIRAAEKAYRKGRDTLARIAKRVGIGMAGLDSATALMRELRVSFANARLPWKGAVQFTVGGQRDDVLGYLYSPSGEVPLVSPEEYFYLEDLGGGWWIFRAT